MRKKKSPLQTIYEEEEVVVQCQALQPLIRDSLAGQEAGASLWGRVMSFARCCIACIDADCFAGLHPEL